MALKIKNPFHIDNTPIYFVDEEKGVLGRANKNGSITINKDIKSPAQIKEILSLLLFTYALNLTTVSAVSARLLVSLPPASAAQRGSRSVGQGAAATCPPCL